MIKVIFVAVLAAVCGCERHPPAASGAEGAGNAAAAERKQTSAQDAKEEQKRISSARSDIAALSSSLDAFEIDMARYPTTEEGLQALVQEPAGAKTWHGPYIARAIPNDPWGKPYVYLCPGKHNMTGYDLYSADPDGKDGAREGVCNWAIEP